MFQLVLICDFYQFPEAIQGISFVNHKRLEIGVWDLWPMLSAFSLKPRRCRRRQRSKLQPRKDRKEKETREEEKEGIGQQCPTLRTERVSYVWWLGYEWCGSVRLARLVAGLCMDPEANVVGQLKSMLAQHLAEESLVQALLRFVLMLFGTPGRMSCAGAQNVQARVFASGL